MRQAATNALWASVLALSLGLRGRAAAQDRGLAVQPVPFARRFALVIGNGHYEDQEVLENALNDAQEVNRTLRRIGFVTEILLDSSRDQTEAAVERFIGRLRRADLAVVYYAGHGLAYQGTSYLVPVEFRGRTPSSLARDAYSATNLVQNLAARDATTVVIFDACRNNPFTRSMRTRAAGRRRSVESFTGVTAPPHADMVVINATSPGMTAADTSTRCPGHSPFTCSLVRRITESRSLADLSSSIIGDVRADTADRQCPWFSLASARPIILSAATGAGASVTETVRAAPPAPARAVDPAASQASGDAVATAAAAVVPIVPAAPAAPTALPEAPPRTVSVPIYIPTGLPSARWAIRAHEAWLWRGTTAELPAGRNLIVQVPYELRSARLRARCAFEHSSGEDYFGTVGFSTLRFLPVTACYSDGRDTVNFDAIVRHPVRVDFSTTAPPGAVFSVVLDQRVLWSGAPPAGRSTTISVPGRDSLERLQIHCRIAGRTTYRAVFPLDGRLQASMDQCPQG